jgi:hypothetical protein
MIVRVIAIVNDSFIDIVLAGQEMLWICVPLRVEKYSVVDDVSSENDSSILILTPPWPKLVETFIIFTFKELFDMRSITNLLSILKKFVM